MRNFGSGFGILGTKLVPDPVGRVSSRVADPAGVDPDTVRQEKSEAGSDPLDDNPDFLFRIKSQ